MSARSLIQCVLVAAACAGMLACAPTRESRSVETSGFLGDYSMLAEGKRGESHLIYVNPATDFTKYDRIIIDEVTVLVDEDSAFAKVDPEKRASLVGHLQQAIIGELGKDYYIVTEPGPTTMRLRMALTESRASNVVLDSFTTIIPQTRLIATATQITVDTSTLVGKASAEAEFVDSVTGERLAAAVDQRTGSKVLKGVTSKWADVRQTFDLWAERMRVRLEEERMADGATPKAPR